MSYFVGRYPAAVPVDQPNSLPAIALTTVRPFVSYHAPQRNLWARGDSIRTFRHLQFCGCDVACSIFQFPQPPTHATESLICHVAQMLICHQEGHAKKGFRRELLFAHSCPHVEMGLHEPNRGALKIRSSKYVFTCRRRLLHTGPGDFETTLL